MDKRLSGLLAEIELFIVSLWINLILTHSHSTSKEPEWLNRLCTFCMMSRLFHGRNIPGSMRVGRNKCGKDFAMLCCTNTNLFRSNECDGYMNADFGKRVYWVVCLGDHWAKIFARLSFDPGGLAGSMRWAHIHRHSRVFGAIPGRSPLADNPIRFVLCGFNVDTCPLLGRMSNLSGNFAASSSTIQYSASYKKINLAQKVSNLLSWVPY